MRKGCRDNMETGNKIIPIKILVALNLFNFNLFEYWTLPFFLEDHLDQNDSLCYQQILKIFYLYVESETTKQTRNRLIE